MAVVVLMLNPLIKIHNKLLLSVSTAKCTTYAIDGVGLLKAY